MKSLIVIDIQNDFLPGGPLGILRADEIVPVANRVAERFERVVATQDWHPPDHGSFAANHPGKKPGDVITLDGLEQILWPTHCVQETPGAAFAEGLDASRFARVFRKGTDSRIDSYSGFFDNAYRQATGLGDYLKQQGVSEVHVLGLATDVCVKFTVLDAIELGFDTHVIVDGCRAVELKPGDCERALEEMKNVGANLLRSEDLG